MKLRQSYIGRSILRMVTGLVVLTACVVLTSSSLQARVLPKNSLFDYTNLENEDIRNRREVEKILDAIQSKPETMSVDVIRLNEDLLHSLTSRILNFSGDISLELKETPVTIALPSNSVVEFDRIRIQKNPPSIMLERNSPPRYFLSAFNTGDILVVLLMSIFDGKAIANIHARNEDYFISYLGGSLHALWRIDQSEFPNEGPPNSE